MSWINNSVIYQIFIDRFAGFKSTSDWEKPEFIGGNIQGIIEKLPYLKKLGVNVIWISPFNEGVAYHGYHITDYYKVDGRFGTEKDLKKLIDQAHKLGFKIICDFVPNHCSNSHPYFIDAQQNVDSKYKDWFIFDNWPNKYQCFLSYDELPKLNLDNKNVVEHLTGAARKWLHLGFDGFRIDHVVGLSNKNLQDLLLPLRTEFPDAVFIGEAWLSRNIKLRELKTIKVPHKYTLFLFQRSDKLYENYIGILDGVLDFKMAFYLDRVFCKGKSRNKMSIGKRATKFHDKISLATFLDNHDMERFMFRCNGDVSKLKDAARLQFSISGPAIIYYGTEVGVSQTKPFSAFTNHADLQARKPMDWDPSNQNSDLLAFYQEIIKKKLAG